MHRDADRPLSAVLRHEAVWLFVGFFVGAALLHLPYVAKGFVEDADNLMQLLPYKAYVGQALRGGELPLWNPLAGIGMPVAGNPQYGLYYPANVLFVLLSPLVAQTFYVLLHFALAGTFTALYLRELELRLPARLFGAVAYTLCGPLVCYLSLLPMLAVFPWFPAAMLALDRYRRSRRSAQIAWAALALALAVLAGHPPLGVNMFVGVGLYGLALGLARRDWGYLGGLALSALLAGGLVAILLLPVKILLAQATLSDPALLASRTADGSFRPDLLFDLLSPDIHCELYLGLLPLPLALYAVIRRQRLSTPVRPWAFVAGGALILMLGHFSPLWGMVRHLPLLRYFRYSVRHDISLALAVAVLSAAALDRLAAADEATRNRQIAWLKQHAALLLVALLLGGAFLRVLAFASDHAARRQQAPNSRPLVLSWRPNMAKRHARPLWQDTATFALAAGGLLLFVRRRRLGGWLLTPLLLIDLGSLSLWVRYYQTTDPALVENNLLAKAVRKDYSGDGPPRVVSINPGFHHAQLWNAAPFFDGVGSINISDPIDLHAYSTPLGLDWSGVIPSLPQKLRSNRLLSLLGVGYVLAPVEFWQRFPWQALHGSPGEPPRRRPRLVARIASLEPGQPARPHGFALGGSAGQRSVRRIVELRPYRSYEIAAAVSAPEAVSGELRIDLTRGGAPLGDPLVIDSKELSGSPHRFTALHHAGALAGGGELALSAEADTSAPLIIDEITLTLAPLPRPRTGRPDHAASDAQPDRLYTRLAVREATEIRRNRAAMPRGWLVREVRPAASLADAQHRLLQSLEVVDPEQIALVEGLGPMRGLRGGSVEQTTRRTNEVAFACRSRGPGVLIVNAMHLPGWSATVDGRPAQIYRAYGLLRAVRVPDGRSVVRMTYTAPGWVAGAAISSVALSLCLILLAAPWLRRRLRARA